MADKEIKPKAATKPAPKPAAKTTTAPKPAAKTTGTVASKPTTAAKLAQPARPATPATKPNGTVASRPTTAAKLAQPARPATPATKPVQTVRPAAPAPAQAAKTITPPPRPATTATRPAAARPATQATKPTAATRPVQSAARPAASAHPAQSPTPSQMRATTPAPKQTASKKTQTAKSAKNSGGSAKVIDGNKAKKVRIIAIAAVAAVLVIALVIGLVVGLKSCKKSPSDNGGFDGTIEAPDDGNFDDGSDIPPDQDYENSDFGEETLYPEASVPLNYNTQLKTSTQVGYASKEVGTVERKPHAEVRDQGLGAYPKYGYSLSTVLGTSADKVAARNALIAESSYLTATGTLNAGGGGYTWMDEHGNLYSGTRAESSPTMDDYGHQRKLYKHSASVGLYMGDVADDEPAIIKTVTMRPRTYIRGYGVTGVYAPAGEVIKIQLSDADMTATGGITVHIGQAMYNGKANNIWTDKNQMPRIPHLLNTMQVSKDTAVYDSETGMWTAYVGSFIGGPIYIRNESVTFTATVSGGVAYSHFILGYTTKEEFEKNAKSSAPYFDLEVWDSGVLHSGPKALAQNFTYEDIYNAAILWDKVANVTTTNGADQGIVFLYDPFVAAGAAVAFPGQGTVNCPTSWMISSLNYNAIISVGSWGNFHEYHHNFQNFGVGYTGEVTNNALNLVSYSLFTKISAARQIASYGAEGLGGWNTYTSATWALQRVNTGAILDTNGLAVYATLLHNFGQDAFIKTRGVSGTAYFNKWQEVTHQDLSYYANSVSAYGGSHTLATNDYPMFVPVSSVYQTGRSYTYDGAKKYITTMQPYCIKYGAEFTVDLRPYSAPDGQYSQGSIIIGNGFAYKIKSVSRPSSGTLTPTATEGVYTYTPGAAARSGEIKVTLEITTADGGKTYNGKALNDVDLVLEFEQTHELDRTVLERTTYTYSADNKYTDARDAYENNYSGYVSKSDIDHTNPTQNCNTDIWYYPAGSNHPGAPEHYFAADNTVVELRGKLKFNEAGKYRIYLRGRKNCAVYYSLNGANYSLGAYINDNNTTANFRPADSKTYFDVEVNANSWIYFKEVLVVQNFSGKCSYIGLGMVQWAQPMYTTVTKYYNASGAEVAEGSADAVRSETLYFDASGKQVTAEQANDTALVEPSSTVTPAYLNGYRNSYQEIPSDFKSEYFYKKQYTYSYRDEVKYDENSQIISYKDGDGKEVDHWWFAPENIFNELSGDNNRFQADNKTKLPITLTADIGKVVTANRCEITGYYNGNYFYPKRFKILVYKTLEEMQADPDGTDAEHVFADFSETDAATVSGTANVMFTIPQAKTFRYYKIVVIKTSQGVPQFRNVKFLYIIGGNTQRLTPDDAAFTYKGNWGGVQTFSTFGHVYLGTQNSTMSFEFNGKRLGFFSSAKFENSFEVYVDGKKIDSISLKEQSGDTRLTFLSSELESGNHTVELKCTGETSIDSVVIYE